MMVSTKGALCPAGHAGFGRAQKRRVYPPAGYCSAAGDFGKIFGGHYCSAFQGRLCGCTQGKGRRLPAEPGSGGVYGGQHSKAYRGLLSAGGLPGRYTEPVRARRPLRHTADVGKTG